MVPIYTEAVRERGEDVPDRFLEIQQAGPFRLGTGSALDEKYLLRMRGQSDDPLDDLVLEAKEIRSLAGVPCVTAGPKADPFRFLDGPDGAKVAQRVELVAQAHGRTLAGAGTVPTDEEGRSLVGVAEVGPATG